MTEQLDERQEFENQLADDISQFYADPLGFVLYAFEWDKPPLNKFGGPDQWQIALLKDIGRQVRENRFDGVKPVKAIREAVSSGHGIGKSAITAWLILWIMSTRPYAKGVVTANTSDQLKTKTWAELGKWKKRCVTGHWFNYNNTKGNMNMYHLAYQEEWRCDGQTCREENSESFAGLHAAESTAFYIFDEASAVPDKIWEVSEGGLTDGEPMWFVFGNPTKNTGRFRECFRKFRKRWGRRKIDSRTVKITNKQYLNDMVEDHGEDSDIVKVRVRGEFPSQSDDQYVSEAVVDAAQKRETPDERTAPLIYGIDFARSGSDSTVIRARRGRDAKTVPPVKFTEKNSMVLCAKIADYFNTQLTNPLMAPDAIFGDGGGLGGPIIDRLNQLHFNVIEVNNQWEADDKNRFANKRAEVAHRLKSWLETGSIDDCELLKEDICVDELRLDRNERQLMMSKDDVKEILGRSPDDGDALRLTFAYHVEPKASQLNQVMNKNRGQVRTADRDIDDSDLGFRQQGSYKPNKVRTA